MKNSTPFIRYAAKTTFLPNINYVQAYDNRLIYIIKGEGVIKTLEKTYQLSEGILTVYPAGTVYHLQSSVSNPLNFFIINFDYNCNYENIKEVPSPVYTEFFKPEKLLETVSSVDNDIFKGFLYLTNMQCLESILENVVNEMTEKQNYYRETVSAYLQNIFCIILRSHSNVNEKQINNIIAYIRQNLSNQINNRDIASALNYHPVYINKIIKKQTGLSLHKFLMKCRIDKASNLLITTNYSISEISNVCGFINPNHLSVYFKKKFHSTPTNFRKRYNI